MTQTQKRVKIAEACGWKHTANLQSWFHSSWPETRGVVSIESAPDYFADLNAAHEAWCSLTVAQHNRFRLILQSIVAKDGHVTGPCRSVCNATAAQRSNAFGITLKLWKEGK